MDGPQSKTCEWCGASFGKPAYQKSELQWSKRRFCSGACHHANRHLPSRASDELVRKLYVEERLSIIEVGKRISKSFAGARNAILRAGIELRPASCGIEYHGGTVPDRQQLSDLYHVENLSRREIAEKLGLTVSMMDYWFRKYGIPLREDSAVVWKGSRGRRPDEAELRAKIGSGLTLEMIADDFMVSRGTVARACTEFGIPKPAPGYLRRYYRCRDGLQVRSQYEQRVGDWLIEHGIGYEYEPRLEFNRRWRSDFLANGWYIEIWGMGDRDGSRYSERRAKKVAYYKDNGHPLIQIESFDFNRDHNERWASKLAACLNQTTQGFLFAI